MWKAPHPTQSYYKVTISIVVCGEASCFLGEGRRVAEGCVNSTSDEDEKGFPFSSILSGGAGWAVGWVSGVAVIRMGPASPCSRPRPVP